METSIDAESESVSFQPVKGFELKTDKIIMTCVERL